MYKNYSFLLLSSLHWLLATFLSCSLLKAENSDLGVNTSEREIVCGVGVAHSENSSWKVTDYTQDGSSVEVEASHLVGSCTSCHHNILLLAELSSIDHWVVGSLSIIDL